MKKLKQTVAFLLTACLLMSSPLMITGSFAEDAGSQEAALSTMSFTVTYHQTEARSQLSRINSLRTGSDAWYWNEDNTEKVICSGLSELTYDYDLEKTAMQRAAEIAVYYSHTRPNGEMTFTAFSSYSSAGENIAYGYSSAESVQKAFEEANENYSGQGHRRNLLFSKFTAIGIACAEYNGLKYWVQEFRTPTVDTAVTPANDSDTRVTVDYLDSLISSVRLIPSYTSLTLRTDDSANLPDVTKQIIIAEKPKNIFKFEQDCAWTSSNESVAEVSSGKIRAVAPGNAVITGTCDSGQVSISVKVTDASVIPAENVILNVKSSQTVAYGANVTVIATASNVPDGYVLAVYDGGAKEAQGNSASVTFAAGVMMSGKTYTVKVFNPAENTVLQNENGTEIKSDCRVDVNTGFISKLVYFIKSIFGIETKAVVQP